MQAEGRKLVLAESGTGNFKHIEQGDYLISLRSFEGGIEYSNYSGCVSPAYTVLRPQASLTSKYWTYLFKSRGYVSALCARVQGIRDGKNISYEDFGGLTLPVPPPSERNLIAAFLDRETAKIDALIAEQEQLIALLEEMRQAIISNAVTKGLDSSVPMKDSEAGWLGAMPQRWQVKPLMRLTDPERPIMYGIVLPGPDVGQGIPILKGGNVRPARMNVQSVAYTTPEIEKPYARARLIAGDLVYSIRGSIGDCESVPQELAGANITQDVARVAPAENVNGKWLRYALQSSPVRDALASGSLGATIRGINIFDLKRAAIPTPPLEEQSRIATWLDGGLLQIDVLVSESKRAMMLLRERRSALISAAVTGKIDVRGLVETIIPVQAAAE